MKFVPSAVASKLGRPLLHLQKTSPQLMFGIGVVSAVGATVLACRATLKLSDALTEAEELKVKAEMVHEQYKLSLDAGVDVPADERYDEKTLAKDLTVIKIKTALNVTKLYAPSAGLMMLSIGLLTGSHITLNKRNASLAAAYASVDQAFEKYRERVVAELGKSKDDEFRYGTEKVEEVVEGKEGKTKTVTRTRAARDGQSMYAKFFDELCSPWQRNPEYNRAFLHCQQQYFNQMLQSRGHVFLNEVYDALGIPRTGAGAVVGWVLSKDGGDNFVDFGVFDDAVNPNVRDFVNGHADGILLDFNVDGVIYDKI